MLSTKTPKDGSAGARESEPAATKSKPTPKDGSAGTRVKEPTATKNRLNPKDGSAGTRVKEPTATKNRLNPKDGSAGTRVKEPTAIKLSNTPCPSDRAEAVLSNFVGEWHPLTGYGGFSAFKLNLTLCTAGVGASTTTG